MHASGPLLAQEAPFATQGSTAPPSSTSRSTAISVRADRCSVMSTSSWAPALRDLGGTPRVGDPVLVGFEAGRPRLPACRRRSCYRAGARRGPHRCTRVDVLGSGEGRHSRRQLSSCERVFAWRRKHLVEPSLETLRARHSSAAHCGHGRSEPRRQRPPSLVGRASAGLDGSRDGIPD
jgi:hypothetical protein